VPGKLHEGLSRAFVDNEKLLGAGFEADETLFVFGSWDLEVTEGAGS